MRRNFFSLFSSSRTCLSSKPFLFISPVLYFSFSVVQSEIRFKAVCLLISQHRKPRCVCLILRTVQLLSDYLTAPPPCKTYDQSDPRNSEAGATRRLLKDLLVLEKSLLRKDEDPSTSCSVLTQQPDHSRIRTFSSLMAGVRRRIAPVKPYSLHPRYTQVSTISFILYIFTRISSLQLRKRPRILLDVLCAMCSHPLFLSLTHSYISQFLVFHHLDTLSSFSFDQHAI